MGLNMLNYEMYSRNKNQGRGLEDVIRLLGRALSDAEDEDEVEPDENEPDESEPDENEPNENEQGENKTTRRGNVVYVPLPSAAAPNALPFDRVESAYLPASPSTTRLPLGMINNTFPSETTSPPLLASSTVEGSIISNTALPPQPPFDKLENTGFPLLATPQALPGANQKDPFMVIPGSIPSSLETSYIPPAVAVPTAAGQLLPGINQPDPVLDEIATPAPVEFLGSSQMSSSQAKTTSEVISLSPVAAQTTSSSISSSPVLASTSTSSSSSITATSSSVALESTTKSFLGKEAEVAVSTIPASTTPPMSSDTPKPTSTIETTTMSSATMAVISTLTATSTMTATAVPQISQGPSTSSIGPNPNGTGLSPVARMVLIAMGILGALAILVLLIVVMMMRKKRAAAAKPQSRNDNPFDYASTSTSRVTTWVSSNGSNNDNPFLSAEEKANRNRGMASSSDTDNAGSRLQSVPEEEKFFIVDALSSFVAKTRRLTYKISP